MTFQKPVVSINQLRNLPHQLHYQRLVDSALKTRFGKVSKKSGPSQKQGSRPESQKFFGEKNRIKLAVKENENSATKT